jgi:hypothetical protein
MMMMMMIIIIIIMVVIVTVNDTVMKVFSNIMNFSKIKQHIFPEETVKKNTPE